MAKIDYHARIDTRSGSEHIGVRVLTAKPKDKPAYIVVLRPGVNAISDQEWADVQGTPGVMQLRAAGMLTVLEEAGSDKAHRLVDTPLWQAMQAAKRTTDPEILEQWIDELDGSDLLDSADVGQMWSEVLKTCRANLAAATTDAKGKPAKPRKIRLGSEAA